MRKIRGGGNYANKYGIIEKHVHSHRVDMQLASSNLHWFEKVCITPVSSTAQRGLYCCSSHTKSHCFQSDRLGSRTGAAGLAVRKPSNIFKYEVTIWRLGSLYSYMSTQYLLSWIEHFFVMLFDSGHPDVFVEIQQIKGTSNTSTLLLYTMAAFRPL